ncbi:MAG: hypothetical protein AB9907_18830 [Flexilinea sp.]
MPESIILPGANQIRQELQNIILRDLLGPAGGPSFSLTRHSSINSSISWLSSIVKGRIPQSSKINKEILARHLL